MAQINKRGILEKLYNELNDGEMDIQIVDRNIEEDIPFDTLTAIFTDMGYDSDEVCMEAGFIEYPEDNDEFAVFFCNIIFDEDLEELPAAVLREAIGRLNCYIPNGGFACENGTLTFKSSSLLPGNLTEDDCMTVCRVMILTALNVTNQYVLPLLRLSDGSMTLDEVYEGLLTYDGN